MKEITYKQAMKALKILEKNNFKPFGKPLSELEQELKKESKT